MANLAASQRLDWVIPGLPFGNGSDGAYSSATIPTLTKDSCSGTSGNATLTTTGSTFANGDILLLHQTRGTSAGVWEVAKVLSGGGSTSLTLTKNKVNTYTDSGASQAQAIKIPQYTDCTVQTGTWTVPGWDGNVGGIFPIAVKGTLTVTGNISVKGGDGVYGSYTAPTTTGGGFYGGYARGDNPPGANQGQQGEGTAGGLGATTSASANSGGGGYNSSTGHGAGGSGGHAAVGIIGNYDGSGIGGAAAGAGSDSADLVNMHFGGGGGGCSANAQNSVGSGGAGGGIILLMAKTISVAGTVNANGGVGGESGNSLSSGGSGAGGSVLIVTSSATLGTTKTTAIGGNGSGADGSVGRIAIHHSGTVTGTTSPTFTDVTDTSLVEASSGFFLMF